MLSGYKRKWYQEQILKTGQKSYKGKELHEMNDKELKVTLTILRMTGKD